MVQGCKPSEYNSLVFFLVVSFFGVFLSFWSTTTDFEQPVYNFLFNHFLQESDQASQQEWSEKNGHIGGAEYLENQKPEGEK